jgi:hypothetical protein
MPAEALATAETERAEGRRMVFARTKYGFLALWVLTLVLLTLPLHSYWQPITTSVLALVMFLVTHKLSLAATDGGSWWLLVLMLLASALLVLAGLMFGPLLVLPIFTIGTLAGFLSQPSKFPYSFIVIAVSIPIMLTLGLELAGVLPSTFEFEKGRLILQTPTLDLTPMSTLILVGLTLVTQAINTTFVAITTVRVQVAAQNAVHAQTWHLKQLLPSLKDPPKSRG